MLDWKKLLSSRRKGKEDEEWTSYRSPFLRDFDRIVFSNPFRRLQDKTQVFPLIAHDHVHNRLTHSLETASVGRSLGIIAWQCVQEKVGKIEKISDRDIGDIVSAAALAHDIGNPPFGHLGERAIGEWFEENEERVRKVIEFDNDKQEWILCELKKFEGNAYGFHLLLNDKSLRLTYATLGAFTKYPYDALVAKNNDLKKYGYFCLDADDFENIMATLCLHRKENGVYMRHPLSYLVEAADDICYLILDLEDGIKMDIFRDKEKEIFDVMEKILLKFNEMIEERKFCCDLINRKNYYKMEEYKKLNKNEKIAVYRARVIDALVHDVADVFVRNYNEIMNGVFDSSLIDKSSFCCELEEIRKWEKESIYQERHILAKELSGYRIVRELVDIFFSSLFERKNSYEDRFWKLFGKRISGFENKEYFSKNYDSLLKVIGYVAGMTDSFALTTYRYLKGIEVPEYIP